MAASDSFTVLQSSVLVTPVTALEFLGDDCLLSGEIHAEIHSLSIIYTCNDYFTTQSCHHWDITIKY